MALSEIIIVILLITLSGLFVWYTQKSNEEPGKDCQLSEWSAWSDCEFQNECDLSGSKRRTRTIIAEASPGKPVCSSYTTTETGDCTRATPGSTCEKDCQLSEWSVWSDCEFQNECDKTGKKTRTRYIIAEASPGKPVCSSYTTTETGDCTRAMFGSFECYERQ